MLLALSALPMGAAYAGTVTSPTAVHNVQAEAECKGVVLDATGEPMIGASVVVKGKSGLGIYLCGCSGFYYTPQRCTNGICHGNIADTAFCFRRCDKVGLFSRPAKLPPDMDTVPFKVDICSCQAIQLTHTQAGSHKNDDIIIIVAAIVLNELQIFLLLFSGQGIAHISVLRHNVRQLELKWILADDVILYRHLKRRSDNALQDSYGVLLETAVMQKHEPAFRIGQFYRFDGFLPKGVGVDPLDRRVVRTQ